MLRQTMQVVACDPTGDGRHRVVARAVPDTAIPNSEQLADGTRPLATLEAIISAEDLKTCANGSYLTVRVTACDGPKEGSPDPTPAAAVPSGVMTPANVAPSEPTPTLAVNAQDLERTERAKGRQPQPTA